MTGAIDDRHVRIHYPSDLLPATPSFDIDLPASWEIGQIPGVLLAAGPAEWEGPFRTNVTVNAALAPRTANLENLARGYLAGLPEGSYQVDRLDASDAEFSQLVVRVTLADPPVEVLQNLLLIRSDTRPPDSDLVDVFTVTASCEVERAEDEVPVLLEIVRSFDTA